MCRVCGNHGASMAHTFYLDLGDGVWRECTRCRYGWLERCPAGDGLVAPGQYV